MIWIFYQLGDRSPQSLISSSKNFSNAIFKCASISRRAFCHWLIHWLCNSKQNMCLVSLDWQSFHPIWHQNWVPIQQQIQDPMWQAFKDLIQYFNIRSLLFRFFLAQLRPGFQACSSSHYNQILGNVPANKNIATGETSQAITSLAIKTFINWQISSIDNFQKKTTSIKRQLPSKDNLHKKATFINRQLSSIENFH